MRDGVGTSGAGGTRIESGVGVATGRAAQAAGGYSGSALGAEPLVSGAACWADSVAASDRSAATISEDLGIGGI
jgi:hypothetical protein